MFDASMQLEPQPFVVLLARISLFLDTSVLGCNEAANIVTTVRNLPEMPNVVANNVGGEDDGLPNVTGPGVSNDAPVVRRSTRSRRESTAAAIGRQKF